MNFEAAIFDLDRTLLDSMDIWEYIDISFLIETEFTCSGKLCDRNMRSQF